MAEASTAAEDEVAVTGPDLRPDVVA